MKGLVPADVVAGDGEDGVELVLVAVPQEDVLDGGAGRLVDLEEAELGVGCAERVDAGR